MSKPRNEREFALKESLGEISIEDRGRIIGGKEVIHFDFCDDLPSLVTPDIPSEYSFLMLRSEQRDREYGATLDLHGPEIAEECGQVPYSWDIYDNKQNETDDKVKIDVNENDRQSGLVFNTGYCPICQQVTQGDVGDGLLPPEIGYDDEMNFNID